MDEIFFIYRELLESTNVRFTRYLYSNIDWGQKLISITGARGTGKTTLLLQHIKISGIKDESLYVSADNIIISKLGLFKLAGDFYRLGGKYLFIDEIHKYSNWSGEIKNIYDSYPRLKVVFTGSSILDLFHGYGDLSRRLITYNLPGLSFREFLLFHSNIIVEPVSLQSIITHKTDFKIDKPLVHFKKYIETGYYPFFKEKHFIVRLNAAINTILEIDIPKYLDLKISTIDKLKHLIQIIAESSPFKPNMSKIAEMLEVSRNSLPNYFSYLERAGLIISIKNSTKGIRALNKTNKIYLDNTNMMKVLSVENYNIGNARETFFVNQLRENHTINLYDKGDFIINNKYVFEIGGKNKSKKQIKNVNDAYIAKDDIEYGYSNIIPLWHFGLLY